ncbi:MAG: SDR family oxidoreductase [Verrucomicrobia bacterium]|nr:SDR family oxidoreductase [Verrucomicrobiota bacterium]
MMKRFSGRTALISGGLGDIGRAIAIELATHGADVALCGLRPASEAEPFLIELRALGQRVTYDAVDVADADAVQVWVERVEAALGAPTLIIPNAAQVTQSDFQRLTPQQWNRELRVNLDGAFHMAQSAALRLLEHRKPGRIVFIGSWAGHRVHSDIPAYCVAKAGLRMLCQCMALEFAPHGILVNEVAPGIVDAGLSCKIMSGNAELRESVRQMTPVKKLIVSQDVARAVTFLCDPENLQMAGSVIVQDGGLSLLAPRPCTR